jgi:hypothetical protein
VAQPDLISPNFDAIDDVAQISFRLTKDARVSIYATDEQGRKQYVGVRDDKRDAGEYAETWSGVVNERPLRDGLYYYTVEARDRAGNVSVARVPVVLGAGGVPKAKVTSVYIAPRQVLLGDARRAPTPATPTTATRALAPSRTAPTSTAPASGASASTGRARQPPRALAIPIAGALAATWPPARRRPSGARSRCCTR